MFVYGKKAKLKRIITYSRLCVTLGLLITIMAWKQQTAVREYKSGIVIAKSSNIEYCIFFKNYFDLEFKT